VTLKHKQDMFNNYLNSQNRHVASTYLVVGIWNTLFAIVFFAFLYKTFPSLNIQIILFCSFIIANFQSHLMQRKFVWKTSTRYSKELIRFYASSSILYILNVLILEVASRYTALEVIQIQSVATIIILVISILSQKLFVFR